MWASTFVAAMRSRQDPFDRDDPDELFGIPILDAITASARPGALLALSAFAGVGSEAFAARALAGVSRLATATPAPAWAAEVGTGHVERVLVVSDPAFEDGRTYGLEVQRPSGRHVLAVYVDNNIGGVPKDAFPAHSLEDIEQQLRRSAGARLHFEFVDPAAAAADLRRARTMLRMTIGAPLSDDALDLMPLIDAYLRLLPPGEADVEEPPSEIECRRILASFRRTPEAKALGGGGLVRDIADAIVWFGADYNIGGPLRWSPVVVEAFLAGWIRRKVMADQGYYGRVPDVLRAFIRFAGRERGVSSDLIDETLAAVDVFAPEMLAGGDTASPFADPAFVADLLEGMAADLERRAERDEAIARLMRLPGTTRPGEATLARAAAAARARYRDRDPVAVDLRGRMDRSRLPSRDDRMLAAFAGAPAVDDRDVARWERLVADTIRSGRVERRTTDPAVTAAWRFAGAIDNDGVLTEIGPWLLPQGLASAWGIDGS